MERFQMEYLSPRIESSALLEHRAKKPRYVSHGAKVCESFQEIIKP